MEKVWSVSDIPKSTSWRTEYGTTVPIECMGAEPCLVPNDEMGSSQRAGMFGSNLSQFVITTGCESPQYCTSYEGVIGKYDFNDTRREDDIQVLRVIPRFRHTAIHQQLQTPSWTVIFKNLSTKKVDCFEIEQYGKGSKGFGWKNNLFNLHLLKPGAIIPKELPLQLSPAHVNTIIDKDGIAHESNQYGFGVNANIAYISHFSATNDAVRISESLAKRLESVARKEVNITVKGDDIPLNLFGTDDDYRCIAGIGGMVRPDGFLFATRKVTPDTMIEITNRALQQITEHDTSYQIEPGSTIIDIDIYVNNGTRIKLSKDRDFIFNQLFGYDDLLQQYYKAVIDEYQQCRKLNLEISDDFASMVTRYMALVNCKLSKQQAFIPYYNCEAIECIELKITYMYMRSIGAGAKVAGRSGNKGVSGIRICPDHEMSHNSHGRADIEISPESVINRMNGQQLTDTLVGAYSKFITDKLRSGEYGWKELILYIEIVSTYHYNLLLEHVNTVDKQQAYIEDIKAKGLLVISPPNTTEHMLIRALVLRDTFGDLREPVTFTTYRDGKPVEVVTDVSVLISPGYIGLLGKLPETQMLGLEYGHSSQFGIPVKPSYAVRARSIYGTTNVRIGEDENGFGIAMGSIGNMIRLNCINGASQLAVTKTQDALTTALKPTALPSIAMTTEEMVENSTPAALLRHMIGTSGIKLPDMQSIREAYKKMRMVIKLESYRHNPVSFIHTLLDQAPADHMVHLETSDGMIYDRLSICLLNIRAWTCLLEHGVLPLTTHYTYIKNFNANTIKTMLNAIRKPLIDATMHKGQRVFLTSLFDVIVGVQAICERYLPKFVRTVDFIGIAELMMQPDILKARTLDLASITNTRMAEHAIQKAKGEFINLIADRNIVKGNQFVDLFETGILNMHQIPQMCIACGPKSDLTSTIPHHWISVCFLDGLHDIKHRAIESLSVKKASYFLKTLIKDTQYFNRKIRLCMLPNFRLVPGSCGSTTLATTKLPIFAKTIPNFLYKLIDIGNGLEPLTPELLTHLQTNNIHVVKMKSPTCCNVENGVCEACLGYDTDSALFLTPPDVHIGIHHGSKKTGRISQKVMSYKHLVNTLSKIYELDVSLQRYLCISGTGFKIKPGIAKYAKDMMIGIPVVSFNFPPSDLMMGAQLPNASLYTSLSEIHILGRRGDGWKHIDSMKVDVGELQPYLSKEFLIYMKENYSKLSTTMIGKEEFITIPMADFDIINANFMRYVVMNVDITSFVDDLDFMFKAVPKIRGTMDDDAKRLCQCTSIGEAIELITTLIYGNTELEVWVLEVVLKAFLKRNSLHMDPDHVEFVDLNTKLYSGAVSTKLAYEDIIRYFKDPTTFTRPKPPGVLDPFFGYYPIEGIYTTQ